MVIIISTRGREERESPRDPRSGGGAHEYWNSFGSHSEALHHFGAREAAKTDIGDDDYDDQKTEEHKKKQHGDRV